MTLNTTKPPFADDPRFTWSCEKCGTTQLGPEYPGYVPYCVTCGIVLTKTPVAPKPAS